MAGKRLDTPRAKDELPAKLFGIVHLEIEERLLKERKAQLLLGGETRQPPYRLWLRTEIDVLEQLRDGRAFRNVRPKGREPIGGEDALFPFKLFANRLARAHQLVEEVKSERAESDIRLFREVDGGTARIEHAHAGDELVFPAPSPLANVRLRPEPVLDCDDRRRRRGACNDVAEDLLLSARAARALENPDVARLPGSVVAVDDRETRGEGERLVLGERIHPSVMEYRMKQHRVARFRLVRDVFGGKRDDRLWLGEALFGLADLGEGTKVFIGELAAHREAAQRVALPSGETRGPVEDFAKDGHHHLRAPGRHRGHDAIGGRDALFKPRSLSPSTAVRVVQFRARSCQAGVYRSRPSSVPTTLNPSVNSKWRLASRALNGPGPLGASSPSPSCTCAARRRTFWSKRRSATSTYQRVDGPPPYLSSMASSPMHRNSSRADSTPFLVTSMTATSPPPVGQLCHCVAMVFLAPAPASTGRPQPRTASSAAFPRRGAPLPHGVRPGERVPANRGAS